MPSHPTQFVSWVRSVAPYFHAFRGKTFVLAFGGEIFAERRFVELAHDISLLHSTGIRVVLVHGSRPQIEAQLKRRKLRSRYAKGLRITDPVALECVKEAVGLLRVEIDAFLSLGLPSSPMAGAAINSVSTGSVRKVDAQAIAGCLDAGNIAIVSPVGYSPTGEVFNLAMEDVAVATATAIHAEKLIFFSDSPVQDKEGELLQELTAQEAAGLLARSNRLSDDTRLYLAHAVEAVRGGMQRVHIISRTVPGALLIELFTHEGSGTMITADKVVKLRPAKIDDAGGVLKLIEPLEEDGTLVRRGRELLEREIGRFSLIEHDGVIVGCAALYPFPDARAGELACLAVRPDYRDAGYGERLLRHIETQARASKLKKLFVLTTRATHWFIERGFAEANITVLPRERKALYNYQRRSKILVKQT
ncbi:MAG: amino-acid N-acetyltransferase [Betaproteobacteria bacterium]|nr:MAG: amino-acid N-acetyltransferase [Betaproteobacteria bacterium]